MVSPLRSWQTGEEAAEAAQAEREFQLVPEFPRDAQLGTMDASEIRGAKDL